MSTPKCYYGYSMAKNYHHVTAWEFHPTTNAMIMKYVSTPRKGQSRRERYDVCCELLTACGIPLPDYKPSRGEKSST